MKCPKGHDAEEDLEDSSRIYCPTCGYSYSIEEEG